MKLRHSVLWVLAFCGSAGWSLRAESLSTASARQATLDEVEVLLAIKPAAIPADAVDPFYSQAFREAMGLSNPAPTEKQPARPRTDRDILTAIAAELTPSGSFVIGGEQNLLFGEKRVKVGTPLTINFEGNDYTVEITAIDRTSFTLRLNREEITRPIK